MADELELDLDTIITRLLEGLKLLHFPLSLEPHTIISTGLGSECVLVVKFITCDSINSSIVLLPQ